MSPTRSTPWLVPLPKATFSWPPFPSAWPLYAGPQLHPGERGCAQALTSLVGPQAHEGRSQTFVCLCTSQGAWHTEGTP